MAQRDIDSSWFNPFGQNVADAGLNGPVSRGLMATPAATGNGLMGMDQNQPRRDAMMAMAAQLLGGSGWSPTRTSSAEILGRALMASQQARAETQDRMMKQRYMQAQIEEMQKQAQTSSPFGAIDPDQFTPESLGEFQETGNYRVLVPRGGLSGIGNFNPGDYTPESFSKFMKSQNPADLVRYVAPAQPSVQVVNGVPTVVQPTRGGGPTMQDPLTTLDAEAQAAARLAAEKAQAAAVGTASGETEGGKLKKGAAAGSVTQILDLADPLIDASTGSLAGAGRDKLVGVFGFAPEGAQATAQLQILQGALMLNQPRMEGPQGVLDVKLYEQMAGQIGDPTIPRAQKKAALKTIRELQKKYIEASDASASGLRFLPNSSGAVPDAASIQKLIDKYAKPK
jgi:hypothetical protein